MIYNTAMDMNYCRRCGQPLSNQSGAYTCHSGHELYLNPLPTVSLFLLNQAKTHVTLAVRARDPGKGMLDAFGGFVDIGETAEQAQLRELLEETGLSTSDIGDLHYLCTETSPYEQAGEIRQLLCLAYWTTLDEGARPVAADDVAECRTLTVDEVNPVDFAGDDNRKAFMKLRAVIAGSDGSRSI